MPSATQAEGSGADERPAPLIQPPRLRLDEDRTATRLELFFDLAYVLVVAELAGALAKDLTWHGVATFAGLFTLTWWSWVTTTLYANRFDTNDVIYRLAKLGGTLAAAGMAASAAEATGSTAVQFVISYVALRLLLFALYLRAWRHVPEARATTAIYLAGTGAGAALWTASLAVPEPVRPLMWAAGLLVDAAAPVLVTRRGSGISLHLEHLPERFGLFVILVLGEGIAAVVTGLHETHWAPASVVLGAVGFGLVGALWWSYFDLGGAAAKHRLHARSGPSSSLVHDLYVYSHLPVILGMAATAVAVEQFIAHPGGDLAPGAVWVLCGGTATYLAGTALAIAGTSGTWREGWPWPGVAVPIVLGIGLVPGLPPVPRILLVTLAVVVTVLAGIVRQRRGRLETIET